MTAGSDQGTSIWERRRARCDDYSPAPRDQHQQSLTSMMPLKQSKWAESKWERDSRLARERDAQASQPARRAKAAGATPPEGGLRAATGYRRSQTDSLKGIHVFSDLIIDDFVSLANRFEPQHLNSIRVEDEMSTDDLLDILLIATGRFPWSSIPVRTGKQRLFDELVKEYERRGRPLKDPMSVKQIRATAEQIYNETQSQHSPTNFHPAPSVAAPSREDHDAQEEDAAASSQPFKVYLSEEVGLFYLVDPKANAVWLPEAEHPYKMRNDNIVHCGSNEACAAHLFQQLWNEQTAASESSATAALPPSTFESPPPKKQQAFSDTDATTGDEVEASGARSGSRPVAVPIRQPQFPAPTPAVRQPQFAAPAPAKAVAKQVSFAGPLVQTQQYNQTDPVTAVVQPESEPAPKPVETSTDVTANARQELDTTKFVMGVTEEGVPFVAPKDGDGNADSKRTEARPLRRRESGGADDWTLGVSGAGRAFVASPSNQCKSIYISKLVEKPPIKPLHPPPGPEEPVSPSKPPLELPSDDSDTESLEVVQLAAATQAPAAQASAESQTNAAQSEQELLEQRNAVLDAQLALASTRQQVQEKEQKLQMLLAGAPRWPLAGALSAAPGAGPVAAPVLGGGPPQDASAAVPGGGAGVTPPGGGAGAAPQDASAAVAGDGAGAAPGGGAAPQGASAAAAGDAASAAPGGGAGAPPGDGGAAGGAQGCEGVTHAPAVPPDVATRIEQNRVAALKRKCQAEAEKTSNKQQKDGKGDGK